MKQLLLVLGLSACAFGAPVACSGISNVQVNGSNIGGTYSNVDGCYATGNPGIVFSSFFVQPSAGFTSAIIGITSSSFANGFLFLDFSIGGIQTPPGGNTNNGDLKLYYQIAGLTSGIDIHLQATPGTGGGNITINEIACSDAFVNQLCNNTTYANLQAVSTGNAVNVSQLFGSGGWTDNSVYIKKDIQFNNASISEFSNSHAVPEPTTMSMVGLGLLGMAYFTKKRRSSNVA